jgi:hypothetical protein
LQKATKDSDEDVRNIAKKSLATIQALAGAKKPNANIDDALAALIKDVKSNNTKARLAAMSKLKELGERAKPAGPALAEYGMMSPYPTIRNAANEAYEAIDPVMYKELIMLYYDTDLKKRDQAVAALELKGEDAASAIPGIIAYHSYLQTLRIHNYRTLPPFHTLRAMVKIAPADDKVRQVVHQALGTFFSGSPQAAEKFRRMVQFIQRATIKSPMAIFSLFFRESSIYQVNRQAGNLRIRRSTTH